MQQRLMIVRAVHVDQPFADLLEHRERGGAAVDKLAVAAGSGKGALEEQLVFLTGFEAMFLEESGQGGLEFRNIERGLNCALIGFSADERAVGAFAENEVEGANENGFACARLAADGIVAGAELQREVGDQGKIANAQRFEHARALWPIGGVGK